MLDETGEFLLEDISIHNSLFTTSIEDFGVDYDFDYFSGKKHHLIFGAGFHLNKYEPGSVQITNEFYNLDSLGDDYAYLDLIEDYVNNAFRSNELHFYFNENYSVSKKVNLNLGARIGLFQSIDIKNELKDNFLLFQPRVSIEYLPTNDFSILVSAEKIEQPLHLLTLSEVGFPNDLWVPASDGVKPQKADQLNLTFQYKKSDRLNFKASVYDKNISNLVQYRAEVSLPTVTSVANIAWQDEVISGTGSSKGIELETEFQSKNFRTDFSYAFTNSKRKFAELNGGKEFPFRFDQRHSAAINLYQKITPKIWGYANWQFASGLPQTLFIDSTGYFSPISADSSDPTTFITSVNGYSLPDFHRLDVGFLATLKKKNITHEFNVGVQNVYNRKNVWYETRLPDDFLFEDEDPAVQKSGLPLLPVVRYRVLFE